MAKTLYGLTRTEAKTLLQACDGDVAVLGVTLWNKGKVVTIERGIYKAKRLKKFSEKGE